MDITPDQITSRLDLERLWRTLMGELGFGERTLWLLLVTAAGVAVPALTRVDDLPLLPDPAGTAGLVHALDGLRKGVGPDTSVALLLTRPGEALDDSDRAWARALDDAARAATLTMWPLHVATDRVLRAVGPDGLAVVS